VKAGNDRDGVFQWSEEQTIGKPAQTRSPHPGRDFGKAPRMRGNTIHLKRNLVAKLVTERPGAARSYQSCALISSTRAAGMKTTDPVKRLAPPVPSSVAPS
jgi:hypothetical protein